MDGQNLQCIGLSNLKFLNDCANKLIKNKENNILWKCTGLFIINYPFLTIFNIHSRKKLLCGSYW